MPATTSRLALPYPAPDDTTDVPRDVKALAEKLDVVVNVPDAGDLKFSARVAEHGNWIKADGRALAAGQFTPLRNALIADGSPYGATSGNPKLPDMAGRAPVGAGAGSGLTARTVGQAGGAEAHTLTAAQVPAHYHGGNAGLSLIGDSSTFTNYYIPSGSGGRQVGGLGTDSQGGGGSHPNMPPYTVGQWFIYAG